MKQHNDFLIMAPFLAAGISLSALGAAGADYARISRLEHSKSVIASVLESWEEHSAKSGPLAFADIVFDRLQQSGQTVHCEVPRIYVGQIRSRPKPGDSIMVAPRTNPCFEPDVVCETCGPSLHHARLALAFGGGAALLCGLLIWLAARKLGAAKPDATKRARRQASRYVLVPKRLKPRSA